jgi:geranylgeranylglycerol-phosphate geranylgeranyltransferase
MPNLPRTPATILFAHLETMRPYTLLWCGLVSLAGAVVSLQAWPDNAALIFAIPILGWIAGLYLADYSDRDLDKIQKPQRPIPSGRIRPREALIVGAVFAIVGLALTFLLSYINVALTFVAAGLVYVYARWTKPHGLLGNLTRGALTLTTFLFGVAAVQPLTSLTPGLIILGFIFFLHDTNSNIIGALRDITGDRTAGCQTTPVKYGVKAALYISLGLSLAYLVLTIILTLTTPILTYTTPFFFILAIGILLLATMYFVLFRTPDPAPQVLMLRAHELFVAERILFASAFIIGIINLTFASSLLVLISLLLTLLSQYLLRRRYELT